MSPKATNIIAYGETIGIRRTQQSDAEGVEQSTRICCSLSASGRVGRNQPSDSRWALMLVAFGDRKRRI